MADETRLGANFAIDTTDLKAGLAQANRLIRESESEFRAAAAGLDDWTESEEGLTARIKSLNSVTDLQRKKVDALQGEYDRLIADGLDPTSRQATELRTKINNETTALRKNEAELEKQTKALEELADESKNAGDATDEMSDKFGGLKAAGGVAVGAIAAVGAACVAAVGSFLSLAESTREARTNMAKLETSFTEAGLTAENASDTFKDMFSILGDEGQATEATAFLAKIADNEEELASATHTLTGIYATFGQSLPLEGLTEAINHTSSLGSVQGNLADALEWSGVNVDDFNAELAKCSDEEERQALIMSTLSGIYDGAADTYKETNADVIASQKAQAELNETLAELGAIAEPIMTTLKTLANDLLQSITPFVSLIGEGLKGALEGADGAADMLAEGLSGVLSSLLDKIVEIAPFVIETITAIVPKLLESILSQLPNILQTLLSMVSQVAVSLGEMLPTLIPVIIDAVIMMAETLLDNVDMIIDAGISLLVGLADGLIVALPRLIDKIPVIIEKLIGAFAQNYPKLIQSGIELTVKLAAGLIQAIPQLLSKIPQIISSIVSGFKNYSSEMESVGKNLIEGLWNGIKNMTAWIKKKIKGFGEDVLDGLKDFFGINSPSKLMSDQVGKNLALGIGEGFEKNIGAVNDEITDAMNFDDANPSASAQGGKFGLSSGATIINYTNNFKQAYTSQKEKYKAQQQLFATVRLAKVGV
jgi:phage-related protein